MGSINSVLLLGNVGSVEVKEFEKEGNKTFLVQASIATSDGYKTKSGEWKDVTEWHRCIFAIPSLAERAKGISKGDQIEVRGSIKTNKWTDKDGNEHQTKEIAVTSFSTHKRASSTGHDNNGQEQQSLAEVAEGQDDLPF